MAVSGGVQAIERSTQLLDLLASAGGAASISWLTDQSKLTMPTVHRILRTLVECGYVRQQADRTYSLGARLISLGEATSRMLGTWALPSLGYLVEQTGETANMAMLEGDTVIYVAQVPSKHSMRTFTEVGRHVDPHCTGVGKALLAELDDRRVEDLLTRRGMPARTGQTITELDEFMVEMTRIRRRGYAVDAGERELGVRCVAVAVPTPVVRAAVSVSGPEVRIAAMDLEQVVGYVTTAAHDVARILAPQA